MSLFDDLLCELLVVAVDDHRPNLVAWSCTERVAIAFSGVLRNGSVNALGVNIRSSMGRYASRRRIRGRLNEGCSSSGLGASRPSTSGLGMT